jgi:hypothetical protein
MRAACPDALRLSRRASLIPTRCNPFNVCRPRRSALANACCIRRRAPPAPTRAACATRLTWAEPDARRSCRHAPPVPMCTGQLLPTWSTRFSVPLRPTHSALRNASGPPGAFRLPRRATRALSCAGHFATRRLSRSLHTQPPRPPRSASSALPRAVCPVTRRAPCHAPLAEPPAPSFSA